ncbi:hypothetical protein, conserved [Eimeria maxima]|uniref:Amine oxidase domain-containing protein n=1 Tax=Eimeria maxima TaxID=5804 RepID=U6MDD4_EIMMA|nr:hypothetical protein, conserved [Eimeria maxima]CDJ60489.1 hypothetical protein, conserved [Eimeria maxima]
MPAEDSRPRICIVGGGLSGLAAAYFLQQQPTLQHAHIRLIEAQQELGGTYTRTELAHAGVLVKLLAQLQEQNQQHQAKTVTDAAPGAAATSPKPGKQPNQLPSLLQQIVQQRLLSTRHLSVAPKALSEGSISSSSSISSRSSDPGVAPAGVSFGADSACIALEFGAGCPHLLAPGGGHLLQLLQRVLPPSQLAVANRSAASVFSLPANSSASSNSSSWLARGRPWLSVLRKLLRWLPLKGRGARSEWSRPGFCRTNLLRCLFACFHEIFLGQQSIFNDEKGPRRRMNVGRNADLSVASFAELHSSRSFAADLILPPFSACTWGAQPEGLSARAYLPRGWLMHEQYGSLLRGCLAERRLSRVFTSNSGCCYTSADAASLAASESETEGPRLIPVEGCKAFQRGHQAPHQIVAEGAGLFSPVGGMRQVVAALARHICAPPEGRPPVSVELGCRVQRLEPLHSDSCSSRGNALDASDGAAAVICAEGRRFLADLVICALHPFDLSLLLKASSAGGEQCRGKHPERASQAHQQRVVSSRTPSSARKLCNFFASLPSASYITVHAFGSKPSDRAAALGRGCFYGPSKGIRAEPAASSPVAAAAAAASTGSCRAAEALAGLEAALKAAQEAVAVTELQFPGNVFPHVQAKALAAAGRSDISSFKCINKPLLLHAQAAVSVKHVETLLHQMQQLLMPLQLLLQPGLEPPVKREEQKHRMSAMQQQEAASTAASLRALGLLLGAAEEAVDKALQREGITESSDRLVMCSRLSLQAEPQWPLVLEKGTGGRANTAGAQQRHQLLQLLRQFDQLRSNHWRGTAALHAVSSHVPLQLVQADTYQQAPTQGARLRVAPRAREGGHQVAQEGLAGVYSEQQVEDSGYALGGDLFVESREDFHRQRVQTMPWLQVCQCQCLCLCLYVYERLGVSICVYVCCMWATVNGAREPESRTLLYLLTKSGGGTLQAFAAFPHVRPEHACEYIARLQGGRNESSSGSSGNISSSGSMGSSGSNSNSSSLSKGSSRKGATPSGTPEVNRSTVSLGPFSCSAGEGMEGGALPNH